MLFSLNQMCRLFWWLFFCLSSKAPPPSQLLGTFSPLLAYCNAHVPSSSPHLSCSLVYMHTCVFSPSVLVSNLIVSRLQACSAQWWWGCTPTSPGPANRAATWWLEGRGEEMASVFDSHPASLWFLYVPRSGVFRSLHRRQGSQPASSAPSSAVWVPLIQVCLFSHSQLLSLDRPAPEEELLPTVHHPCKPQSPFASGIVQCLVKEWQGPGQATPGQATWML